MQDTQANHHPDRGSSGWLLPALLAIGLAAPLAAVIVGVAVQGHVEDPGDSPAQTWPIAVAGFAVGGLLIFVGSRVLRLSRPRLAASVAGAIVLGIVGLLALQAVQN